MSLREEAKRNLREHGIIPKKRLGQSFLVDKESLHKMVACASLCQEDVVLEIGAGLGFLTERLAEIAGKVVAVEVDPRLTQILRNRLKDFANVSLVEGDILKIDVRGFNKVVSTPPYSISSPLLFWLLEKGFELSVLAFQEEFAQRLAAPVGSRDYGRLTVSVYCHAEVELLDLIPKECFWPMPEVDSRIVRLRPKKPPFKVDNQGFFDELVKAVFSQKNRKVRNALSPLLSRLGIPKTEAVEMADALPFCDRRPRELAPEEIGLLANEALKVLRQRQRRKG
ncbi:ribosomal RNA small subunit methyltransferase A [Candidatus Bathyarchaeota archaeon]|nr:ribosomal RNA small subunit methyltransferase A [Candidatus Bathyarchaeota archaeon]